MRYVVNPMVRRGLGQTSDQTTIDTTSVLNVGDRLRQAQADLSALLTAMQQNPQLARSIGPSVVAQQQSLGDLISKYVYVYTAVFGNPPAGLGIAPIVVTVAVAAAFVIIVEGLQAWQAREEAIKAQAQQLAIAAQNQAALIAQAQSLQRQADAASSAGDAATAAALQAQATQLFQQAGSPNVTGTVVPPKPPSSFADWLQANWVWVALIGGGIFVAAKAVD